MDEFGKKLEKRGTVESNEEARKRLSLHLTGKEDATPDEMNSAIDWLEGDNRATGPLMKENSNEPIQNFLRYLQKKVSEWEIQILDLQSIPEKRAFNKAKITLIEIKDSEDRYKKSWSYAHEKKCTKTDKEKFEILTHQINILKDKLQEFIFIHNKK